MLPRICVTLFLSFWLLACDGRAAQEAQSYDYAEPARPALWHVAGKAGDAYLFGTIHVLPPDISWRTDAFDDAVRRSDRLTMEISPDESPESIRETFTKLAITADASPILERIDPSLHNEAAALFAENDIYADQFIHMKSWGAAVAITGSMSQPTGATREDSPETWLTEAFRKKPRAIGALESAAMQFRYFDDLSEPAQRAMLEAVIADADKTAADYRTLLGHWLSGDVDAIAEATSTGVLARADIRSALVTRRNAAWSKAIATMIDTRTGTTFIAVGAGHLAGPDALETMLADKGYKVTRVQ